MPAATSSDESDWEDVPLEADEGDWEDVPLEAAPASAAATPEQPDPGFGRTLAVKFAEGALKGWSDELGGAIGKAVNPDPIAVQGGEQRPGAYELARGAMRREQHAAADNRPKLAMAAQIAGDLASDYLLSKAGVPVASLPYQVASGALSGAGVSEEKGAGDVLLDAGAGAGIAAATHGIGKYVVGPAVGAGARFIKPKLQDFAAGRALKAAGATAGDLMKGGMTPDKIREVGRKLIDWDVIRPFFGAGKQATADRAADLVEKMGPAIGESMMRADQLAAQSGRGFDWGPVMQRINSEVRSQLGATGQRMAGSSIASKTGDYAPSFFDDIAQEAADGGGFSAANRLKSEINDAINFGDSKLKARVAKQVSGILNDEIEKQLEGVAGKQAADEFKTFKSLYSAFKPAEQWAGRSAQRELGNRWLSPSDMGLGGIGAIAGAVSGHGSLEGAIAGGALALAHKIIRERGPSVAAVGANKMAKSAALRTLANEAPELLGRLSPKLAPGILEAAKKGDRDFAVYDYASSMSDPEYRKLKEQLERGQ